MKNSMLVAALILLSVVDAKTLSRDDARATSLRTNADSIKQLNEEIEKLQGKVKELENPDLSRFASARADFDKKSAPDRVEDSSMCTFSNCEECTAQQSCGWCSVLQKCFEGDRLGPANAKCTYWNFETCKTGCQDYFDCDSCLSQAGCGFCMESCKCLEGRSEAGPDFDGCASGWYHGKGLKTCPMVQRLPGDRAAEVGAALCEDIQFRRLKEREILEKVDRADSWRVAEALEKSDKELW